MSNDDLLATKDKSKLFNRLIDIKEELEQRNQLYQEFDEIVLELVAQGWDTFIQGECEYYIKDQLQSGGNAMFTTASARRYDLKGRKAK